MRLEGEKAVFDYDARFDGNFRKKFKVSRDEIEAAYGKLPAQLLKDMREAAGRIEAFARAQKKCLLPLEGFQGAGGAVLGHRIIPVDSCLCYVPGGKYPLYSSALILIIPAKIADVRRVAACSPAVKGTEFIHPFTLAAMDMAGADEIYAVGGAHAVAAFSYGTEQTEPVDMIVGPGNQYVAEAKRQCFGQVGIDFVAGPSEVLIIADGTANPAVVAADLLAQSEHDRLAKGILITTDRGIGKAVLREISKELETLETRETAGRSWEANGEVILAGSMEEAEALANQYAPEHLEVIAGREESGDGLHNFGALFLGQETGEVFGDYVSGTNHTLPTARAARYTGGVWAGTFLKVCTFQHYGREEMRRTAPLAVRMAEGEGLMAHARAAKVRQELL